MYIKSMLAASCAKHRILRTLLLPCTLESAENEKIITKTHGTITHMAPEVITEATHSKAADVYSFGVVLFELVSGLKPYVGMHYAQIVASITSGKLLTLLPEQADHQPPGLTELMAACLASDPADRPSFQQVHAKLGQLEQQLLQDPKQQQLQQGPATGLVVTPQAQQQLVLNGPKSGAAAAAAAAAAVSAAASAAGSSVGGEGQALLDVIAAAQQQRPPPGAVPV
jgi:serine/threonine protein kinase